MAIEVAAILLSLGAGALTTLVRELSQESPLARALLERIRSNKTLAKVLKILGVRLPEEPVPVAERIEQLFRKFGEVSKDMEAIVQELAKQIEARATLVQQLEREEQDLQERITALEGQPEAAIARLEARVSELVQEQSKEAKRSALRDYLLYVLGVLTPIVITVVLRYAFDVQW